MSTRKPPPPIDPDELDEYMQELADDAELERIAGLSHAEVVEELKKEGVDVARGYAVIDRALEQAERGGAGGAGGATSGPATATGGSGTASGTAGAAGQGDAKVVSLAAARARRVRAIAAAGALAAGAATVFEIFGSSVNVANPRPKDDGGYVESPREKAEKLRERAEALVIEGYYGEATDALDAAKALDPEGEKEARVKKTREAIGKAGGP